MIQQKQYKFNSVSIIEGSVTTEIVTLNECVFSEVINEMLPKEEKLENKKEISWLLKVHNKSKEQLLTYAKEGVTFEGNKFKFWISTPSDMRKSTLLFVREDKFQLVKDYEKFVSGNWLGEDLIGKQVSINKDVLRVALHLSSAWRTSVVPNVIIVPEEEYITKKVVRTLEGEELVESEKEINNVPFDGNGIMTLEIARQIRKDLGVKHEVFLAGFRVGTLALKGQLNSIDLIAYLEELHQENGDTKFFKKVNGNFFITDIYENERLVDKNTIIIPKSCAKWVGNYKSMEEVYKNTNPAYGNVLHSLFVTKVNMSEEDLANTNKRTSYQLLSQLNITNAEYVKLAEPTYNLISSVINPNSKEKVEEIDSLELNFKNKEAVLTYLNANIRGLEEGTEEDIKMTSKIATLLSTNYEEYSKENWIRRNLALQVQKTCYELASGSMFVKGAHFKTLASEPLALIDFACTRELKGNLEENEFWSANLNKEILVARYPIAMYSEIQKFQLVPNNKYAKYCNHWTEEVLVFNIKGIQATLLSGADFDMDTAFCSDNSILINSIVAPKNGIPFLPQPAGGTVKKAYSEEVRKEENVRACENAIGKIALLCSSIADNVQSLEVISPEGIAFSKKEVYENFLNGRNENEVSAEEKKDFYSWFNTLPKVSSLEDEQQKQLINERFYANEKLIGKIVTESMVAIDIPKTGISYDKKFIEEVGSYYKYPLYFKNLPESDYKSFTLEYKSYSVLTYYSYVCERTVLKWTDKAVNNMKNAYSKEIVKLANAVMFLPANNTKVEEVYSNILQAFEDFDNISKIRNEKVRTYKTMNEGFNAEGSNNFDSELVYKHSEEKRKALRSSQYFKAEKVATGLYLTNEPLEVAKAVAKLIAEENYTKQKFVIDFFFPSIELMVNNSYETLEGVVESSEGKLVLFDKMKAVKIPNKNFKKLVVENSIGMNELKQFARKSNPSYSLQLGIRKEVPVDKLDFITLKVANNKIEVYNEDEVCIGSLFESVVNKNQVVFELQDFKLYVNQNTLKITDKSINLVVNTIK